MMSNQAEWVAYTGSDEQIAEIEAAFLHSGFIVAKENGGISEIIQGSQPLAKGFVSHNLNAVWGVKKYLICNPHPHAEMARQQLRTGQPVWVKMKSSTYWVVAMRGFDLIYQDHVVSVIKSTTPDWNIPNAEYSFDEFKEEV